MLSLHFSRVELNHGLHLAYCTNIHRGESWPETFAALSTHTLAVRDRVCPNRPFAIGLRLSERAAADLADPETLRQFQRWLDKNAAYVFTINGFPYGQFHGTRVKEQVYAPDWTTPARLAYTNRLFDLLAQLLPPGLSGSVSTLPGSFKEFITTREQMTEIHQNLFRCVEHIARLSERSGRDLHLGLEPEPLGLWENSAETIAFFHQLRDEHPHDPRLARHLGVNYDTCHFALQFEEPAAALAAFRAADIRISKLHLSSALKTRPTPDALNALKKFADDIYLHQVIIRDATGTLTRHRDLPDALTQPSTLNPQPSSSSLHHSSFILHPLEEWRIHFHVPLHAPAASPFANTNDHLLGVLDQLAANPPLCTHLEMETYTWEVLPPELKSRDVVEQLVAEYHWTLAQLHQRGLA